MRLWLYRLVVMPTTLMLLPGLALFNRKIRQGLALRLKTSPLPNFTQQPLWLHAASGEFEYAKPVIRELKARHPHLPVVVTYFSPTFRRAVENFPGVDFALPLPLDLPGPCHSLIKRLNPRALLIARTDLWPELLTQAGRRKIPIHVFSYTQKKPRWPLLSRLRLNLVDSVDCVSTTDLQELQALRAKPKATLGGDTRYDQVRFRLDHPKALPNVLKPVKTAFVAGSTWPEDEAVLLPGLAEHLKAGRLQLILVPHEPTLTHLADLKKRLSALGLTHTLFSEQKSWSDQQVLLVDQIGVLAELYEWGHFAFVGGSFKKTVHSVMEALGAGCITFVGPKHLNNREAVEFSNLLLHGKPGIAVVSSSQELKAAVAEEMKATPKDLAAFQEALTNEFKSRQGATLKLVNKIETWL